MACSVSQVILCIRKARYWSLKYVRRFQSVVQMNQPCRGMPGRASVASPPCCHSFPMNVFRSFPYHTHDLIQSMSDD